MKIVKGLLIGFVALILFAFIAIGILLLAIDRGEYKQEIIQQVEAHTGRSLTINGDLDISLFPWIGITIGELTMSNAEGFGGDPFVQAEAVNVKIEVLPLLRRELRVDTIQLVGVVLDLQRNRQGVGNWEDLVTSGDGESKGTSSPSTPSADSANSPIAALAIGGVEISDARIHWRDQLAGSDIVLHKFNLSIGEIKLHETFPLSMSLVIDDAANAISVEMKLTSDVAIDIQMQKYRLGAFTFNANMKGENLPEQGVELSLSAAILSNLVEQTVAIRDLQGTLAGIAFSGNLGINQLNTIPVLSGGLDINTFDARVAMEKFEITPPLTARAEALTAIDAHLAFIVNQKGASLEITKARIDSTALSGKIVVEFGTPPEFGFALAIDSINLDDYLPPLDTAATASDSQTQARDDANPATETTGLPLAAIAAQNIGGELTIGKLTVANLKLSDIRVLVSIRGGVAKLDKFTAGLYRGSIGASAEINASNWQSHPPSMSASANIFGVQVGPLLDDLLGDGKLSGVGDVRLDLATQGDTQNDLKAALNGNLAINFRDGAVDGINIAHSLRAAKARLLGGSVPTDEAGLKTDFSQLSASGTIVNGVLSSDDLDMRSPLLRITGKGDVDLNRDYVDYRVSVLVTGDLTGQGGASYADLSGLKLTIPLRGHFDDLGADFTAEVYAAIKQDARDKIDKKLEAVKAEKKKLQKKLKQDMELEKKKLEDKLKDKFKNLFQ